MWKNLEQVLVMSEGVSQTQYVQVSTLKWQSLPSVLFEHIFYDSEALPNRFESQAQTPLLPPSSRGKRAISSDSQWF